MAAGKPGNGQGVKAGRLAVRKVCNDLATSAPAAEITPSPVMATASFIST
jgi:hypothetical protein